MFAPDNVNVPAPAFVNPKPVPDTTPEIVPVMLLATCTVAVAVNATVFDNMPAAEKFTAPADDTPVPAISNGSFTVSATAISSVNPEATSVLPVADPSADVFVIFTVPPDTVVVPSYVFAPDNVNVVPLPAFVSPPVPLTTPANVVDPAEPDVNVAEPNAILTLEPSPDVAIDPTVSL